MNLPLIDPVDGIRKRPTMYVGSTGLYGLAHVLDGSIRLVLGEGPAEVDVAVIGDEYTVSADVAVPLLVRSDGTIYPFEGYPGLSDPRHLAGTTLAALSDQLRVEIHSADQARTLDYARGVRVGDRTESRRDGAARTGFRFALDRTIFDTPVLSPWIVRSFLRRLGFLHPGVRFRFSTGGVSEEFRAEGGIRDLFPLVSATSLVLHEPIAVAGTLGPLRLELVLAFQAAGPDQVWSFINNGRAERGGTHELGLHVALRRVRRRIFGSPRSLSGVVGVASMHYPDLVFHGATRSEVANRELRHRVARLASDLVGEWLDAHPEVSGQIGQTNPFFDHWFD